MSLQLILKWSYMMKVTEVDSLEIERLKLVTSSSEPDEYCRGYELDPRIRKHMPVPRISYGAAYLTLLSPHRHYAWVYPTAGGYWTIQGPYFKIDRRFKDEG